MREITPGVSGKYEKDIPSMPTQSKGGDGCAGYYRKYHAGLRRINFSLITFWQQRGSRIQQEIGFEHDATYSAAKSSR